MIHEYELVVVAKGDLSEKERTELIEEIKELVEVEKGEIVDIKDWGRRMLAYEIKKNNHGFYSLITFKANSKTPAGLNTKLRIDERLLRYLVVRKEEKQVVSSES